MIDTNILLIILAVVAVLVLAFLVARPRRQKLPPPAARSDELYVASRDRPYLRAQEGAGVPGEVAAATTDVAGEVPRSEEHTSELQSLAYLVCRLLLEKKNQTR